MDIELADPVVPGVGQIKVAVGRNRQTVHAVEPSCCRRASIAAVSLLSGSRDGREYASAIHLADALTGQFDEKEIAGFIKHDAERRLDFCSSRGRAVGPVAAARHEDELFGSCRCPGDQEK